MTKQYKKACVSFSNQFRSLFEKVVIRYRRVLGRKVNLSS